MTVFDRYLFRNLFIATLLTSATLTAIIFLAQSLQFLELIMNSGASIATFWLLTFLAIPRFFEIIVPVALMAATVFVYNRMSVDSELVAVRASGAAPLQMARPALVLAVLVTIMLAVTSMWIVPASESDMDATRVMIKSQYSTMMFREGIFNPIRPGLTAFIRSRQPDGQLAGIIIHDGRKKTPNPVTVIAKRGEVVATPQGQQILVYDGSRQDINPSNGTLNRLDFERYTIDLPTEAAAVSNRWREPSQRSFFELFHPDINSADDMRFRRSFIVEINRRVVSPLLALSYTALALAFLLLGPVDRRGQNWRVVLAIASVVAIQGFYMAAYSIAKHSNIGLFLMYVFVLIPLAAGLAMLRDADMIWGWKRIQISRRAS
ncbi:MAG TPA: LptF/LptG family permease [Patescibacteria group bacterium]|nr:LptF/LptG family permease [Patescibacteria group bacterium]